MRRLIAFLSLLALAAGCASGPQEVKGRAAAYTNAVYVGGKDGLREAADPGPLKFNGEYYAYFTGDPCFVLKSDDLVDWQYVGPMYDAPENCWAPDVVYKNGLFHAYVSSRRHDEAEGLRRVKLFTAAHPAGPFTYQATLTEFYSYDAHYFADPDGAEYLYWTQECGTMARVDPCTGNGTVGDRLIDMNRLAGQLTRVASPEGWECRHRCILEAPDILERDGLYYMHYSGAAYENESYGGAYLRSATPLGPDGPLDTSWTKFDRVLKSVEFKVDGPGGAAWVRAPNNFDDWTIYHGRGITREDWDRWLRIDPVMWGRDQFWLPDGPTYTPQPGPGQPQFRDLFNRPDAKGLGKEWSLAGGQWAVAGGAARQSEASGGARALAGAPAHQYAFEANLRWLPGQGGGTAGIYAYYADEQNQVTVLLDRPAQQLRVDRIVAGEHSKTAFSLPHGFNFEVWHQLIIRKNADLFSIYLDGQPLGDVPAGFSRPGRAGLLTRGAAAEFDGIAMAHGWEDFFDQPALSWVSAEAGTRASGDWQVADSMLLQAASAGRAESFKGDRTWGSYEFTASLRPLNGSGAVGLYASYHDPKNYVEVLLDLQAGTLQTNAMVKGKGEAISTPLDHLDPKAFQTIRITKDGFAYRIHLNGQLIQERTIPLRQGQPGLITIDTQAQFDSIRAVRWD